MDAAPRMGFDKKVYPGAAAMQLILESTNLEYCGFYLAPTVAGARSDTSWMTPDVDQPGGMVPTLRAIGWGLLPVYIGRQTADVTTVPDSAHEGLDYDHGSSDADDAVALAADAQLEHGSVIYLDIESATVDDDQFAYVTGWLDKIEVSDYAAGVYCHTAWAAKISGLRPEVYLWVVRTTNSSAPVFDTTAPQNVLSPTNGVDGAGVVGALAWQYVLDWVGPWTFTDPDGTIGALGHIDFSVSGVGDPSRPNDDVWASRTSVALLVLDPAETAGSGTVQITITLTGPACWPNGAYVTLASDTSDLLDPASLRVPVGQQSAVTSVQVGSPSDARTVTVTASCNGQPVPASASLQTFAND